MTDAELQAFIQDELKKARARAFPMADFVRLQSIYGTPRPVVLDAQGNEMSRVYDHDWKSEYMGVFEPAPQEPVPASTLEALKSVEKTIRDAMVVGKAAAELRPGDKVTFDVTEGVFLPWSAPYTFPAEVTITPEPYRSLDADARTRTAEWQESVRRRFERRTGAAITSTPQRT